MRLTQKKIDLNLKEKEINLEAIETSLYYSKKLGSWIPPERLDLITKRNHLCEKCSLPISYSDSLDSKCSICNVVIHISCLSNIERLQNFRNGWVCNYCIDDIKDSKEYFVVLKTKHNYQVRLFILIVIIILRI